MSKAKTKNRSSRIENSLINKWTHPDRLAAITGWAENGYSDKDIAEKMGISVPTFRRYRLEAPEIDQAVQDGKDVVDHKVESALLKAALGYETKEVEIIIVKGKAKKDGKAEDIKVMQKTTTKEQPPNVLACQTWLFNRQRDKWKRNRDSEIAVEDDQSINITIKRAGKAIEVESE